MLPEIGIYNRRHPGKGIPTSWQRNTNAPGRPTIRDQVRWYWPDTT